jgi:FkbM family methyltransferase
LELPTGQGLVVKRPSTTSAVRLPVNGDHSRRTAIGEGGIDLDQYADVFTGIVPWSGAVPGGYTVDFLGVRTNHIFLPLTEFASAENLDRYVRTQPPDVTVGEIWFETVNWIMAARAAQDHFTMVTLGANYGAQAVGAFAALRLLNPMPCKLVAVEPVPENLEWTKRHMLENGINPEEHWLVGSALGDSNAPMLFPIGSPGSGSQNGYATNEPAARENYARLAQTSGQVEQILTNLLLRNTTGLMTNLVSGYELPAEIKLVSCMTLRDIVSAFDEIDYIESDIQQSEILVFPPAMSLLKKKVRRIHIGTHGSEVHAELRRLFIADGWQVVFDFAPNSHFETTFGPFDTNDGILTVANPALVRQPVAAQLR